MNIHIEKVEEYYAHCQDCGQYSVDAYKTYEQAYELAKNHICKKTQGK